MSILSFTTETSSMLILIFVLLNSTLICTEATQKQWNPSRLCPSLSASADTNLGQTQILGVVVDSQTAT